MDGELYLEVDEEDMTHELQKLARSVVDGDDDEALSRFRSMTEAERERAFLLLLCWTTL